MKRILAFILTFLCCAESVSAAEGYYIRVYTADEKLIREDFSLDEDGKNLSVGPDGYARRTLEYDERGNTVRETYYDENGEPAPNKL